MQQTITWSVFRAEISSMKIQIITVRLSFPLLVGNLSPMINLTFTFLKLCCRSLFHTINLYLKTKNVEPYKISIALGLMKIITKSKETSGRSLSCFISMTSTQKRTQKINMFLVFDQHYGSLNKFYPTQFVTCCLTKCCPGRTTWFVSCSVAFTRLTEETRKLSGHHWSQHNMCGAQVGSQAGCQSPLA